MLSAARSVVVLGIVAQMFGFVKLLLVAAFFGIGPLLDGYYLGLVVPAFLTGMLSPFVQTGFVPAYLEAKTRGDGAQARRLRDITLTSTTGALAVIALGFSITGVTALDLLWRGINRTILTELQACFVLLIWTAPLKGLADTLSTLLNAEGRYSTAAGAPVVNAIVGIMVLALSWRAGIYGLVWSQFAGLSAQVILIWLFLRRDGIRLRIALPLAGSVPRVALAVGLPVLISGLLSNAILAFMQVMAARTGPGGVSAFGYAHRLHNFGVQTIVMSISYILLPHFSRLISEGRSEELGRSLSRVFAATSLFFGFGLACVAVVGPVAVRIMLQRGHFTAADGRFVAEIWLAMTVGLLGIAWGIFLVRLFQAMQKPWIVTKLTVVSLVCNVALAYLLMPSMGVVGIALAHALSYLIVMALFHRKAAQMLERFVDRIAFKFALRTLVGNAVTVGVAMVWGSLLNGYPVALTLGGQLLMIVLANVYLARTAPLGLTMGVLLRGRMI